VRLLTVGLVNKSKNQLGVVEAARILREKGIPAEVTVIGATGDAKVDSQICAEPFVRRIPHIQKEQLVEEYRKADIFVLPSFAESFGLVYAEALTQGVPVVYSAGQGFDRQFPEGVVGYRVDARSPEAIAEGILQVLQKYEDLQKNCGEAAECFAQNAICTKYEECYTEALARMQ
jgi:glycosyltransferase involved in cell wall biosynthesis